jgi:hypothetical protein
VLFDTDPDTSADFYNAIGQKRSLAASFGRSSCVLSSGRQWYRCALVQRLPDGRAAMTTDTHLFGRSAGELPASLFAQADEVIG